MTFRLLIWIKANGKTYRPGVMERTYVCTEYGAHVYLASVNMSPTVSPSFA